VEELTEGNIGSVKITVGLYFG